MSCATLSSTASPVIPMPPAVWRLEEAPYVDVLARPLVPAPTTPAAPALARTVNPGCFSISIYRPGADYADARDA